MAPLVAINRPEIAVGVGPFIPDANTVLVQVADVRLAAKEPQQLVDDRAQVKSLGCQKGETGVQVETHLPAEYRERTGARTVALHAAPVQHVLHQIQILPHVSCLSIAQPAL
ncbi:MAG: hypothetical protein AW07_00673 [Candidatus Accumulibacter sp. SK-11]|nr:MAG: hypothetical protein AW07_00673 [Candidatus Accumulibacter sp. SK-11]